MKDEKFLLSYMKQQSDPEKIMLVLPALFQEITDLLDQIKMCESERQADINFDVLEEIHLIISEYVGLKKIKLPKIFIKFFDDFDCMYDMKGRTFLFNEIKSNQYFLDFQEFFIEQLQWLFEKIKACASIDNARKYFDCIELIQNKIALLICTHRIQVALPLKTFFKEFDHIGEIGGREELFFKIKCNLLNTDFAS